MIQKEFDFSENQPNCIKLNNALQVAKKESSAKIIGDIFFGQIDTLKYFIEENNLIQFFKTYTNLKKEQFDNIRELGIFYRQSRYIIEDVLTIKNEKTEKIRKTIISTIIHLRTKMIQESRFTEQMIANQKY